MSERRPRWRIAQALRKMRRRGRLKQLRVRDAPQVQAMAEYWSRALPSLDTDGPREEPDVREVDDNGEDFETEAAA